MASILVIEDDPLFRRLMCRLVENAGHDVREAADGECGLAAARDTAFDLVITDYSLPSLSGGDLIRALRDTPGYGAAPIVVVSAHEETEEIDSVMAAGATSFVNKAQAPDAMLAQILAALS